MKELVIYGASYPDVVKLIDKINGREKSWKVVGFLDDMKKDEDNSFMEFPVLGGEEAIRDFHERGCYFINNVFGTTRIRKTVSKKLDRFHVNYATLIAPGVDTRYVQIGYDCNIMDGCKFGSNTVIGNHVGIRFNSLINHDSVVEDHVFIGPGAIICGRVKIREGAYIGAGAIIKENLTINAWSTVGMGAVVTKDVKENSVVAVPPARPIEKLVPPIP